MTSASAPIEQRDGGNSQKSHFQQTICLADWWLIKAENGAQGRELAVAGSTSREKQAVRVFSSAPILKRYDAFTLETSDGICVILNGLINKDRTLGNGYGFPSNVCDFFGMGFPPYWKEYRDKFLVEGEQMPVHSPEKDLASQGKMKGIQESKSMEYSKNKTPKANFGRDSKGVLTRSAVDQNDTIISGEQMPAHSPEKDLGSQGKMKGIGESKSMEYGKNEAPKANFGRDSKDVLTRSAVNQTDEIIAGKNSLSKKAKALGVETERKFAHATMVTPDSKKQTVPSASPESLSINRYRSVEGEQMPPHSPEKYLGNMKSIRESKRMESGKNRTPKANFDRDSKGVLTRSAVNQTDEIIAGKNSLSEKAKALGVETERKFAHATMVTPDSKKQTIPIASPESFGSNRSRSGRLLMPVLEFWRNQRVVYDADRTITGIEQDINEQPQKKGRKRKQQIT